MPRNGSRPLLLAVFVALTVGLTQASPTPLPSPDSNIMAACDFETNLCGFTTPGPYSWTRLSGSTSSVNTGPSGDHTTGTGHYVYVEASDPNFPNKGPFVLNVALTAGTGIGEVSFWYNMFGADMGDLGFETSSNGVAWDRHWTKSGNLGIGWSPALVSAQDPTASFARFVGSTSTSNAGDMALDDVSITAWSTEAPTLTAAPSISSAPSFAPSGRPSPAPSTTAEFALVQALRGATGTASLAGDVLLTKIVDIEGLGKATIEGNGFAVDGMRRVGCFLVRSMQFIANDLTIANGRTNFGAAARLENVTAAFSNCILEGNEAVTDAGALRMFHSTVTVTNTVIRGNIAHFGGAIVALGKSQLFIVKSSVVNNRAIYGGGIYIYGRELFASISESSRFVGNNATIGGAVFTADTATLNVSFSSFEGNTAAFGGGGLYCSSKARTWVVGSDFLRNQATEGGGLYLVGSDTILSVLGSRISGNMALGSNGGGLFIGSGRAVLSDTLVSFNAAIGASFNVTSGNCVVSGGCAFSPNHPDDYPTASACDIKVLAVGLIDSAYFSTEFGYDFLRLMRNGSNVAQFDGTTGPDGLAVEPGDVLRFNSDSSIAYPGFQVCYATTSSGGGVALRAGHLALGNVTLEANGASKSGGGLWMTNGVTAIAGGAIHRNSAPAGSAVAFDSGELHANDLTLDGSVAGVSAANAECTSPCPVGSYGQCDVSANAPHCFVNCACSECPAGRASSVAAATSADVCVECGAGQVAAAGAVACEACPPGTFATDDAGDRGGGQTRQVSKGASLCNRCPRTTFSSLPSQIVCGICPAGYDSEPGDAGCALAHAQFYLAGGVATRCPPNARCLGGVELPRPLPGFWVDRRDVALAAEVVPCTRNGCKGGVSGSTNASDQATARGGNDGGCWRAEALASAGASGGEKAGGGEEGGCDADALLCAEGSAGPLCGYCDVDFIFSVVENVCEPCGAVTLRVALVLSALLAAVALVGAVKAELVTVPRWVNSGMIGGLYRQVRPAARLSPRVGCSALEEPLARPRSERHWPAEWGLALYFLSYLLFRAPVRGMSLCLSFLVDITSQVDSGTLRLVWATYQIVESASAWTLGAQWPKFYDAFLSMLTVFALDLVNVQCLMDSSHRQLKTVLFWSALPMGVGFANALVYRLRVALIRARGGTAAYSSSSSSFSSTTTTTTTSGGGGSGGGGAGSWASRMRAQEAALEEAFAQHMSFFLVLTYLVLPPVALKQFETLDCVDIVGIRCV